MFMQITPRGAMAPMGNPNPASPTGMGFLPGNRWDVRAGRRRRRGMAGLGDVNSDAVAALAKQGITGSCQYVAYTGPLAGGANLCDVQGDTLGATYSAELVARPGGAAIAAVDIANANAYNARRAAQGLSISTGIPITVPDYTAPGTPSAGVPPVQTQHNIIPAPVLGIDQALPPAPAPIQTATISTPVGGGNPSTATATPVTTASGPGGFSFTLPSLPTIDTSNLGSLPWGWIAAGVAGLFILPKLTGGR